MADIPEDSTRDLISGAEDLLREHQAKKGNKDDTATKLEAEADALMGKNLKDEDPSTRQLLVDAEKLAGRAQAEKKKGGGLVIAIVVLILLGGAAAAYWLFAGV